MQQLLVQSKSLEEKQEKNYRTETNLGGLNYKLYICICIRSLFRYQKFSLQVSLKRRILTIVQKIKFKLHFNDASKFGIPIPLKNGWT